MKNVHKRINAYVELCTDRRNWVSCQQLKERKLKLLTENEMGHSLGDDIDKVILVKHAVSLGSEICYATVYSCCTVHNTEWLVLWNCANSHAENLCYGSYMLTKRQSLQHFVEDSYFSQYSLRTFHRTSRTCLWKAFVILFYSLFVFLVGHYCLLTYSVRNLS